MSEDFSEGLRMRRMVLEPRASGLPFLDTVDIELWVLGHTRRNRKAFRCRVAFAVLAKVGGTWFRGSATVEAYHRHHCCICKQRLLLIDLLLDL